MQIIKDKQLVDNTWTFVDDDSEFGNSGDITVSLNRWESHKQQLAHRSGRTGIRLSPGDHTEELADTLNGVELIELDFPVFSDGRPFSHARLLRSRLGYQGEIRAVGHFLPDQIFYLARVGVDAFQLKNKQQVPLALSCLDDFTVRYQASSH
jgi:uncharacterized protein (DUF934 family)